jgi:hypothetical protein
VELDFICYDEVGEILDLTNATSAHLFIKRGNEILKRTATLADDRTTGIISYTITDEDLTIGDLNYQLQVAVDFANGAHISSSIVEAHITKPLEADYVEE